MNTTATHTLPDPSFSELYDIMKADILLLGQEMHDGSAGFHAWLGMFSLLCVCMCYVTAVAQTLLFVEGKIGIVGGLYTILDSACTWIEFDLPCLLHNGLQTMYAMPITVPLAVVWIAWRIVVYLIVAAVNGMKRCLRAIWDDITQPIQDPTTRGLWMLPYNTVCVLYTIITCTVLSLVWCVRQVCWIVTGVVCGVVHMAVFVACFVGGSLWYLFVTLPCAIYAWSVYYPRILSVACVNLYKWGWNDLEIFVQETYDMVFDWYDDYAMLRMLCLHGYCCFLIKIPPCNALGLWSSRTVCDLRPDAAFDGCRAILLATLRVLCVLAFQCLRSM